MIRSTEQEPKPVERSSVILTDLKRRGHATQWRPLKGRGHIGGRGSESLKYNFCEEER
jgi:hypothetical protein